MITLATILQSSSNGELPELRRIGNALSSAIQEFHSLNQGYSLFPGNTQILAVWYLARILTANIEASDVFIESFQEVEPLLDILGSQQTLESHASDTLPKIKCLRQRMSKVKKLITRRLPKQAIPSPTELVGDACFHYSAVLAGYGYVTQNLYRRLCTSTHGRCQLQRDRLHQILLNIGFCVESAKLIAALMPSAYIEGFNDIRCTAKLYTYRTVYASPYGLLFDPILALSIGIHKPRLYYVQHGGSYCLTDHYLARAEAMGATMLYWGLGNKNVYQTRFAQSDPNSCDKVCMPLMISIMFSYQATQEEITEIVDIILTVLGESLHTYKVIVALHPRCPQRYVHAELVKCRYRKYPSIVTQFGVSHQDHAKSGLVIYDNILHTNIYARILDGTPYVALLARQDHSGLKPQFPNAELFLAELVESQVLINSCQLPEALKSYITTNWMQCLLTFRAKTVIIRNLLAAPPSVMQHYECMRLSSQ